MYTNKKELIKQVNWALRLREPLCCGEVNDVRSKWTSEGYEVRFDGGSAMIAHFAGRVVAIENEEETQVLPSGARRAQATPGIKAVVLSASEVIITGIESVNADRKADVRYFDALGRYVGTSLTGAPAGVYLGSDGSKVVK